MTVNGQVTAFPGITCTFGGGEENSTGAVTGPLFSALIAPGAFLWEFAWPPGIVSQGALQASTDPLATLFLNRQESPGDAFSVGLNMGVKTVTITDLGASSVPEPATWGLLVLGFAGVVLCGRKRISVTEPALSA